MAPEYDFGWLSEETPQSPDSYNFNWLSEGVSNDEWQPYGSFTEKSSLTGQIRLKWQPYGIFEKSPLTGQVRLKKKDGALGGLANDWLGHYERNKDGSSFISTFKATDDDEDVLDQTELSNLNRSLVDGPYGWLDSMGTLASHAMSPLGMLAAPIEAVTGVNVNPFSVEPETFAKASLDYVAKPIIGIAAIAADVANEQNEFLGFGTNDEEFQESADFWKDLRDINADMASELAPPSATGNQVKDVFQKWGSLAEDPSVDNLLDTTRHTTAFAANTVIPMLAAKAIDTAAPGVGTVLLGSTYGAMTADDVYFENRFDPATGKEKQGVIPSLASAASAALMSGALEAAGYKGIFDYAGTSWLKGALKSSMKEGITEGAQSVSTNVISDLPTFVSEYAAGPKSITLQGGIAYGKKVLGEAAWEAAAGAGIGGLLGGVNAQLNGLDTAFQMEPVKPVSLKDLGQGDREQVLESVSQLKYLLDATNASPSLWRPVHEQAVENTLAQWGHVQEVSDAIKRIHQIRTDPIAIAKEEELLARTPSTVEFESNVPDPIHSLWNTATQSNVVPEVIGALNQYLNHRGPLSDEEVDAITEKIPQLDFSKAAPTDLELAVHSVQKALAAATSDESRAKLQAVSEDIATTALNAKNSPQAKQIETVFSNALGTILDESFIQEGISFVDSASALAKNLVASTADLGKITTTRGQESIMKIQNRLMEEAQRPEPTADNLEKLTKATEAVRVLNQYLDSANVDLAQRNYISPNEILHNLDNQVKQTAEAVRLEAQQWESSLQTAFAPEASSAQFGRATETMKQMSLNLLKNPKPQWMSDQLHQEIITSSQDPANISKEAQIVTQIREEATRGIETAVNEVVSNYRKAAQMEQARGTDGNPVIGQLASEDPDMVFKKQEFHEAQDKASSQAKSMVNNAFKQNALAEKVQVDKSDPDPHTHQPRNTDKWELQKFIDSITEELSTGFKDAQTTPLEEDVDDAFEYLKTMIGSIGNSVGPDHAHEGVSKFLVETGVIKPKKPNTKRGLEASGDLRNLARAKGWLTPGQANYKTLPMDIALKAEQEWHSVVRDMPKGKNWDFGVAQVVFHLPSKKDVLEILIGIDEGDVTIKKDSELAVAMPRYNRMAKLLKGKAYALASSMPKEARQLTIESIGRDGANGLGPNIANGLRAAQVMRRLMSALSREKRLNAKQRDALRMTDLYKTVDLILTGKGYSRGRVASLKKDVRLLEKEARAENRPGLVEPGDELRPQSPWDATVPEVSADQQEWGEVTEDDVERAKEIGEEKILGDLERKASRKSFEPTGVRSIDRAMSQAERDLKKRNLQGEIDAELTKREEALLLFYRTMSSIGYNFKLPAALASSFNYTTGGSVEKKKALSYIEKILASTQYAVRNGSSPQAIAMAMAKNGYDNNDIRLTLSLVHGMASTFASRTGRPKWEFYEKAASIVFGADPAKMAGRKKRIIEKAKENLKQGNITQGEYEREVKFAGTWDGVGGFSASLEQDKRSPVMYSFERMKRAWIGFMTKLTSPNGTVDIFTPVHELLHGLQASGYLRMLMGDSDAALIEGWLGKTLNSVRDNGLIKQGTIGERVGKHKIHEEKLLNAIEVAVATSQSSQGGFLQQAFDRVRDSVFNLISYMVNTKDAVSYSGVNIHKVGQELPDNVREALVSIFDNSTKMPGVYKVTGSGIVITAAHKLARMVKSANGADIAPYLNGKFESASQQLNEDHVLRTIMRTVVADRLNPEEFVDKAPTFSEFLRLLGVTSEITDKLRDHLSVIYDTLQNDPLLLGEWKNPVVGPTYRDPSFVGGKPSEVPGDARAVEVKRGAELAKSVLETVTPLAHEDTTTITEPLSKLLGTFHPPFLTGNPTSNTKNGANSAVQGLSIWHKMGDLFSSRTHSLEKLLMRMGLTREYLITHNLGGLYAQATAQLDNKVTILDGNLGLGRERWRVINESLRDILDEIPDSMQALTWSYLRARREMEIAKNNTKAKQEWQEKLLAHQADPKNVPYPKKPRDIQVNPTTHAAAIVLATTIDGKYGKDGGKVGEFASRIAKFENAAIAYKLHHYGMISEQEYKDLLNKGEWWIPMAKLQEIAEDMEEMEPFYNDGTKAALQNLKLDVTGIEHPLSEISRRVVSTHMLVSRQFVRTSLLKKLTRDERGISIPNEQLKESLGIVRLETEVPQPVSVDEWAKSTRKGPVTVDRETGEKRYSVMVTVPLNRAGYSKWLKDNVAKRASVYAVWENGQAEYYEIQDPTLRKMIDSLQVEQLPWFMRMVGKATSFMASAITLAPRFIFWMPMKDTGNAMQRSKAGLNILTLPWDFAQGMFQALPVVFPSLARRFPKKFWNYNERINSMANQSSFAASFSPQGVHLNRKYSNKSSVSGILWDDFVTRFKGSNEEYDLTSSSRLSSATRRVWGSLKNFVSGTVDTLRAAASYTDAIFRMQERKLLRQGNLGELDRIRNLRDRVKKDGKWSLEEQKVYQPGFMSDLYVDALDRQLTLDFGRKGNAVRWISTAKMFAGPMFQDTITTQQRLRDPLSRTSYVMKGIANITIPALAFWAMWHDDDDWQRLTYWDKLSYYQLWKRDDGTFAQIPSPIGLASLIFKDAPIALAQLLSEEDPLAVKEWLGQVINQTPLQYSPVGQDIRDWISHMSPTLMEPVIETGLNWNPLANAPIDYDVGKQNAELATERGREKYGVAEYMVARAFDTSPRMTGYFLKQMLPGLAYPIYGSLNDAATAGYQAAGGDPTVGAEYNPVGSFFYKYWSGQIYGPTSLSVNRFYDLYEESSNAAKSIEAAYAANLFDKAAALEQSHPSYIYKDAFSQAYGQIQRMKIERGMFIKENRDRMDEVKFEIIENFDKPMTLIAEEMLKEWELAQKDRYNK